MSRKQKPKNAPRPVRLGATAGFSGLTTSMGRVLEEWDKKLRGPERNKFLREMWDNATMVGAMVNVVRAFLRRVEGHAEAAKGEHPDRERCREYLEGAVEDMEHSFADLVMDSMKETEE